jgi:hypothetical protein
MSLERTFFSQEIPRESNIETEKSKEEILAEKLSTHLKSESFLNKITEIPEEFRGKVIGWIIDYFILLPDGQNIGSFEDKVKEFVLKKIEDENDYDINSDEIRENILISQLIEKFGFTGKLNEEDIRKIFDYVVDNYIINGYYFHAFNGVFEEPIKEKGLVPDERLWDTKELDRISEIGNKYGVNLLGWYGINSVGNLFLDGHTQNLFRYANASPEWFAQFVSEGFHVGIDSGGKNAFYERDYDQAKINVETACNNMGVTPDEKLEIMSLFEKYWNILAGKNSNPKLAMIKSSVINGNDYDKLKNFFNYDRFKEILNEFGENVTIEKLISFLMKSNEGNDMRLQETISPKDFVIVDLPDYKEVFPKNKK